MVGLAVQEEVEIMEAMELTQATTAVQGQAARRD
jgi:hypothetical protein